MNDIETALFLIACPYSIISKVFIFVAPKLLIFLEFLMQFLAISRNFHRKKFEENLEKLVLLILKASKFMVTGRYEILLGKF